MAALAVIHGAADAPLTLKIALTSLLISRALAAALPPNLGAGPQFALSHLGAVLTSLLLAHPSEALLCVLWQATWLAVDFSRTTFIQLEGPSPGDSTAKPPWLSWRAANLAQRGLAAGAMVATIIVVATWPQQPTPAAHKPLVDLQRWIGGPWRARLTSPQASAEAGAATECEWTTAAANLDALTAREAWTEQVDAEWMPAVLQLPAPALTPATAREANAAFGAPPCASAPNLRVVPAQRLRAASGFRGELAPESATIGKVFAFALSDGRRLLVARGSIGDNAPGAFLLMSWASESDAREIWVVSYLASESGLTGVLLAPAIQPMGGDHLWFAGVAAEGVTSFASADIIDLSGAAPRNTGAIPIWGASTCGQVPGDLLYPAEEGCAEAPAWAFWLTDFAYAPGGGDEMVVTWHIRRQFGRAGPPANYDPTIDDTARARFVSGSGRWRFMDGEGEMISDREFRLALGDTEAP